MSRFLETIRIQQGIPGNLRYHTQRIHRTLQHFYGSGAFDLACLLANAPKTGTYRCRVLYDRRHAEVSYHPYLLTKKAKLLALPSDMDYNYKFAERSALEQLAAQAQRAGCDDALIIKEGLVTDTTIANIALWDGSRWITPEQPLLRGTMRQRLIDARWLVPEKIEAEQLHRYSHVALMNALSGFYVAGTIDAIRIEG